MKKKRIIPLVIALIIVFAALFYRFNIYYPDIVYPVLNDAITSRHSFIINELVFAIIGIAIKKSGKFFAALN